MQAALMVGLVLAVLWLIEKLGGTPMVIRPIVVSPIVGLVLGDLQAGVLIGATLELIFMGAIQIGAAVPPDVLVGAGLGTAFAILSGKGAEVALALALPIAILAQSLKVLVFIVRSWFMSFAMKLASEANIKGLVTLNFAGLLLQCLMYFVVAFVAITFGSTAVEGFVASIPKPIMNGLTVAGGLLPAVGFALLLLPMMTSKNIIYFILGFILVSYAKLPILAITMFGVVLAYILTTEIGTKVVTATSEEEVLFDE
ncbi:PTS system, mannose-specific IIC component/PTS system, fructoselysine and glucoselysine-specific IIC component [Clostridium amylolyticum]|uniref:PTS system, mannose-specific IIC component/PTS system, fructoselysine and glucoselysine-specific IIC component n=1 Tax=Clostridium amylolyticum TaxID=1121298 RepID=A0A1M6GL72_9CLOT|nr:PTS sugar transporter subunit IIC [Clostridium amylolyticum]SHJ10660.1 PTS system, mannose-specific IIC component/PTS system, fructoselysine and glucoselysine-specific IIC component [Clostridium amylolyticum]